MSLRAVDIMFYGGFITAAVLFAYDIYLVINYDYPWWAHLLFSVIGLAIGYALSSFVKYSFVDSRKDAPCKGASYLIVGIPFPNHIWLISEDGDSYTFGYGILANPIYFILLTNAVGFSIFSKLGLD